MNYLSVAKFDSYQHYKNRKPSWVKFYVSLLDPNHPMNQLPVPTRYLFDRLLLLAAEWNNAIPNDSELIAKLLRMEPGECREGLDELRKGRWIKVTTTKRRASKSARGAASKSAPPELEIERELDTPPTPPPGGNGFHPEKVSVKGYTGCRFVNTGMSGTYVQDPLGRDKPPEYWKFPKPSRDAIRTAIQNSGPVA